VLEAADMLATLRRWRDETGGAIRRWRDETGDARPLRAARVVLGLLLLDSALRAARGLEDAYFGDVFHWPILPESLVAPRVGYGAVVLAEAVLAAMVTAGFKARPALFGSALLGTYVLLCDRVQFHNNRWALACYSMLLALSPCDQAGPCEGPLWAARLAQVQVALIYVASGGSKLLDPDWRSGRVLVERISLYGAQAVDAGVPQGVLDWLSQPGTAHALAILAIGTELLLSVGLWPRRTRAFALWWGVWFHLTIEATSRVESFTWLTLAMYALFATPDSRARKLVYDATRPIERTLARAIGWLDWLARFELQPRPPGDPKSRVVVVDRDGTRATGVRALAGIARCIPLLFPLWIPLALLAALRRREP
jgi:Vitamin K-dependent gamma-carboxylase